MSGKEMRSLPHCLEPHTSSLFLEILFSNASSDNRWVFLPPFFPPSLCLAKGLVAAALTAGEKLESGWWAGHLSCQLPGLPSSAHHTANCHSHRSGSPAAAAS